MERPSHILFDRHSPFSRAPLIGLAIGLQLAGFWLFTHGLASNIVKFVPPWIDLAPIKPQEPPRTPPPPLPPMNQIEIPHVPPPEFITQSTQPTDGGILVTSRTPTQTTTLPPPTGIDREAAGIAATHTVPPYPPIARRIGAEGVVTLRLTVGTDGRVSAAEIVTSAGRDDLDQAARDWIIAHWRYRPALRSGNPAAAQLLAKVTYSLKNQP
jgi:periplasmic protein TonB